MGRSITPQSVVFVIRSIASGRAKLADRNVDPYRPPATHVPDSDQLIDGRFTRKDGDPPIRRYSGRNAQKLWGIERTKSCVITKPVPLERNLYELSGIENEDEDKLLV